MAVALPTGEQYEIAAGGYRAVITELGATLRQLTHAGRPVLRGFGAEESPSGGAGQQLIPWPNRIRDGRYDFAGRSFQLPLTEPARGNANHGLVRYVGWRLAELTESTATLTVRVFPQPGWPGVLEATVSFGLAADGLTVRVEAANLGAGPLPFGYGAHPYLTVGEETVEEVTLTVPGERYLVVDERMLPVRLAPVDGTPVDFRTAAVLGERSLDTAYTDLARDRDGRWEVRLRRGEQTATLWADANFGWLQVFSGGEFRDRSIAVEPMTCGPNAFNPGPTHGDLVLLEPGQHFTGQWGISGGSDT